MPHQLFSRSLSLLCCLTGLFITADTSRLAGAERAGVERKLLYVATPGIRDELQYGGHGILVFDIEDGHKFVRRIASAGLDEKGKPLNVKGICANATTERF